MNKLVSFLLLGASGFGIAPIASGNTALSLTAGTASGAPGATVIIPITFTAGSTQVAALQCSIGLPSGWSIASVSAGPAATSAAKTVDANQSSGMLVVFGVNQQTISTGVIANLQINIPTSASSGSYSVTINGVILSALDGSNVQAAAAVPGSITVQSNNPQNPTINSFIATPASIALGGSSQLSWNVTGATSLTISPNVGTVTGTSVSVSPAGNTTYTLTATNSAGSVSATTTITVTSGAAPAIISFGANPASIAAGSSSQLLWSVSGATTLSISPNVGTVTGTSASVSPTATTTYTLTASNGTGSTTATTTVTVVTATSGGYQFVPAGPCRVADTRNPNGQFGGPEMAANSTRSFSIPNSSCSIPSTAVAYSLNVTVVPGAQLGYLTIWPTGQVQPYVSTLNSDGRIKANAAIVAAGSAGSVSVYVSDSTHVILDIDGYFVPAGSSPSALAFYAMPPCRIVDTRQGTGPLAGPYLSGGAQGRSFPILSSSCSIPATAEAYSLNFTAVPHQSLTYLTVWPTGQTRPLVSTVNAPTGTLVANAALVPAGKNGNISAYASDDTDLVIDINGYFGPPGTNGLSLYTLSPCRVLDTRNPPASSPFNGTLTVNVAGSGCGTPTAAQAYVLNATVVPPGALLYLTLWPFGQSQPGVSTMNALDGAITSNMAIVPTTNGLIDAFGSAPTNLVLDMSAYFAP